MLRANTIHRNISSNINNKSQLCHTAIHLRLVNQYFVLLTHALLTDMSMLSYRIQKKYSKFCHPPPPTKILRKVYVLEYMARDTDCTYVYACM